MYKQNFFNPYLPSGERTILEVSLNSTPIESFDNWKPKPYLLE